MEQIIIKKQTFNVEEEINSYSLVATLDGKKYFIYDFTDNLEGFNDFKFAYKRLKNSGVTIPNVYLLDKKLHRVAVEYIEGETIFDLLLKADIEEPLLEQAFVLNYKARINGLRLNFEPHKFKVRDGKLYYLPFTFTAYKREEDFTQKEIKHWFYCTDFVEYLISKGIPVQKGRISSEYETNKKMVLMTVKYFR